MLLAILDGSHYSRSEEFRFSDSLGRSQSLDLTPVKLDLAYAKLDLTDDANLDLNPHEVRFYPCKVRFPLRWIFLFLSKSLGS